MPIYKAQVTSQDRFNPSHFSTMYRGLRYDIDLNSGKVWSYYANSKGSHIKAIHNQEVIRAVKLAVQSINQSKVRDQNYVKHY